MDRLKRWFGLSEGKPSVEEGLLPQFYRDTLPPVPPQVRHHTQVKHQENEPVSLGDQEAGQMADIPEDAKVTETGLGQMLAPVRDAVLRVVPLQEGDCLSCKLIGSGACYGASLAVVLSFRKFQAGYSGFRRHIYTAYAVSLATGLTLLGTARLFDMSIFEKSGPEGERKGINELLQEDLSSLQQLFSRLSQSTSPSAVQADASGKK